jgi:hypothetical protein
LIVFVRIAIARHTVDVELIGLRDFGVQRF